MAGWRRQASWWCMDTKRNGCWSQVRGLSISATPSTEPARVKNMSLATPPWRRGRGTDSNPPVTEITCRVPAARPPSLNLSTTGVTSGNLVRSARRVADCGRYGIHHDYGHDSQQKQLTEGCFCGSKEDSDPPDWPFGSASEAGGPLFCDGEFALQRHASAAESAFVE